MNKKIEKLCEERGVHLTQNRRVVIAALEASSDHPEIDELHRRANKIKNNLSISTVYRTLKLLEEHGIVTGHNFGNQERMRYELVDEDSEHHDHLINLKTGEIIEFYNAEIEELKIKIADNLGFELVDHRLELYAVPLIKEGSR